MVYSHPSPQGEIWRLGRDDLTKRIKEVIRKGGAMRGITLIEVLIIVAILGILAAVIVNAFTLLGW